MKRFFSNTITNNLPIPKSVDEPETYDRKSFRLYESENKINLIQIEPDVIQINKLSKRLIKVFFYPLFVVITLMSLQSNAAEYVDTTLVSNNVKYKLLISLPDDYNSSTQYSLVVGLQPCMSATTKNYLIALKALTDSLKMIVVCPDLSKTDNWITDANKNVITTSIDSALAMFNIDPKSVYLTGMSCNGATTLEQGLKKMYPFKGIFPWAPYISGADPKVMDMNSDMPVTIAVGTSDGVLSPSISLYDSLKNHGGNVNLILVAGIGHTYDFSEFGNTMIKSIYYLNDLNSISINYSEAILPNFEIKDTDPEKELVFHVVNSTGKELKIKTLSSNTNTISNPDITYTPADNTVKLRFAPKVGKAGKVVIILEASETGGTAIEQVTFKIKVNKTTSVSSFVKNSKLEVYPNPASDKLYLKCEEENLSVQISDLNGKVVLKIQSYNNSAIDISRLKEGIYFIKVNNNKYFSNSIFTVYK
jgi:poly(3-hydroxybutyrate) depolymerase